jgi:hypothetical protein
LKTVVRPRFYGSKTVVCPRFSPVQAAARNGAAIQKIFLPLIVPT